MKTFGLLFATILALFTVSISNMLLLITAPFRTVLLLSITGFFKALNYCGTVFIQVIGGFITMYLFKQGLIKTFAKIKFGAIVVDASGKLGGHVFSKNRGGSYLRTKVTPVNPQTSSQSAVRNFLTQVSQAWRGLTAAQRAAWNAAVNSFVTAGTFGDSFTPSGFNLHSKLNQNLLVIGQSVITSPPTPSSVTALTSLSIVSDNTLGTLVATFAPAIPVAQSMIVYATGAVSPGKNFVKSEYRKIATLTSADTSPADLTSAYTAKFGSLPATGQKVFVQMKPVVQASGIPGQTLNTNAIAIES